MLSSGFSASPSGQNLLRVREFARSFFSGPAFRRTFWQAQCQMVSEIAKERRFKVMRMRAKKPLGDREKRSWPDRLQYLIAHAGCKRIKPVFAQDRIPISGAATGTEDWKLLQHILLLQEPGSSAHTCGTARSRHHPRVIPSWNSAESLD
jgi:hypothetical protein